VKSTSLKTSSSSSSRSPWIITSSTEYLISLSDCI
jgi:hypothetical protein